MDQIKATELDEYIELTNGKILFKFNKGRGTYDLIDAATQETRIGSNFYEIILNINGTINRISSTNEKEWNWEINDIKNEIGTGKTINLYQTSPYFQIIFQVTTYLNLEHIFFQLKLKDVKTSKLNLINVKPLIYHGGPFIVGSFSQFKILKNDWQSWSPIELVDLSYKESRSNCKFERRGKHAFEQKPKSGDIWSAYFSLIKNHQSSEQIFFGFVTLADQHTHINWKIRDKKKVVSVEAICFGDSLLLEDGDQFNSELLMVSFKKGLDSLEEWARITGTLMNSRQSTSVPVGWCSWYQYYKSINENNIITNIEAAKQLKNTIPLEYFQIDDGYELRNALGDWLETEPRKFPKGLQDLAHQISDADLKPGIWLAPFLISNTSKIYKEHPNWILKDKNGKPIWGTWPFLGASSIVKGIIKDRVFALDLTIPDVLQWLKSTIQGLVKEMGFKYLKIDFIYGGAIEAVRFNPKMTRIQAYRKGLETIRDAAGNETFILGCGAPFGPTIGIVDAMRVSTDTAPSFQVPFLLKFMNKLLFANLETIPSVASAMQQNILRYFFHKHLWINDPDTLIVRHESKLTPHEIQFEVTAIGLLGGLLFISDNLANLSPEEVKLIQLLIPPFGTTARPIDMLTKNYPEILVLDITTSFDEWKLVGIFNWSDKSKTRLLNFDEIFDSNHGQHHVFEFWEQKYNGIHENHFEIGPINPHSVKYFAIHEVKEKPTLISSTFHITQGAIEVETFNFNLETKSLHISLNKLGKNRGALFLYIPAKLMDLKYEIEEEYINSRYENNLLIIELEFQDKYTLSIKFT
ncbi:MAG TPA: glycoside hydrolase family 36 protein [Candidatus Deferrimicrobium sp.]|nr:glycoside hydrolase family 36 protein [Candidatus Deferrimicrobium sp.]